MKIIVRRHCAVCPPLAFRSRHRRVRRHHAARAAARAGPDRRPRRPCRWPSPSRSHPTRVRLLVGRSTVVDVGTPIARVSLTSADVADAMVTSPNQLLVHGKTPGTISMFVWDRAGARAPLRGHRPARPGAADRPDEAAVPERADRGPEQRQATSCCPARSPARTSSRRRSTSRRLRREEGRSRHAAAGREDAPSNQVLLRVRFAEVSRSALTELGVSLFTSPTASRTRSAASRRSSSRAAIRATWKWTKAGSDFGTGDQRRGQAHVQRLPEPVPLRRQKYDLGAVDQGAAEQGLFQSLAEPNLVAESGKEASFLAGGEFPIPVAQGSGANLGDQRGQFKEFGIRLNFTPTVNGDRVHLKVRPEVSTLDFANGVVLQGFRIPALTHAPHRDRARAARTARRSRSPV